MSSQNQALVFISLQTDLEYQQAQTEVAVEFETQTYRQSDFNVRNSVPAAGTIELRRSELTAGHTGMRILM